MREWTEKHVIELIDQVAKQQGITPGGSGILSDYGFGVCGNTTSGNLSGNYINVMMTPALNPTGTLNGRLNYAYFKLTGVSDSVKYYTDMNGKDYNGDNALRPVVSVELVIKLTGKAVGPYNNELIGYTTDIPIKTSDSLLNLQIVDNVQSVVSNRPIPTLTNLDLSPMNLLNFTGENGEIVTCTPTTLRGEYQLYRTQEDAENRNLSSVYMSVPAYEIRLTCGELADRLSSLPGRVKGVVTL